VQTFIRLLLIASALLAVHVAKADRLERAIVRAARTYNVDVRMLQAVAFLESSGGKQSQVRANSNGTWDIGPFQINSIHWKSTCTMYRVETVEGNTLCAARILAQHLRRYPADPYAVGRYHSKTPSKKKNYAKKVKDFLAKTDK
jgi:hypothetical protein